MKLSHMIPPVLMGAMMGTMGIMILHAELTGTGSGIGVGFVLAHVAVAGLIVLATLTGLKSRLPVLQKIAAHRPTLRHIAIMVAVGIATALSIHLIHGGPTWT